MQYYYYYPDIYHHGVKGMKWGVRKATNKYKELDSKKAEYKKAKKAYSKSFNKAYSRSLAAYSPFKKQRDANDKRWDDVTKKSKKLNSAKKDYKDLKKEVRENTTVGQKIGRGMSKAGPTLNKIGRAYISDQFFNNGRGTAAAKKAVQALGILSISAIAKARGATDIHWYDKQGRKIV